MLFKPLGTSRLQRVQGAFVTEEEIALIVEQCRGQRSRSSTSRCSRRRARRTLTERTSTATSTPTRICSSKAIEIVVQTQTASVSLIQRRLRVGYTRAGRLIDMLERRGIISGYEGSKPRRVLVSEGDLGRVLSQPHERVPSLTASQPVRPSNQVAEGGSIRRLDSMGDREVPCK